MSHGGPLVHLWHHIGFLPLLSVAMALIAWLVIQAHDAQRCSLARRAEGGENPVFHAGRVP
jgi:hypothetical protein